MIFIAFIEYYWNIVSKKSFLIYWWQNSSAIWTLKFCLHPWVKAAVVKFMLAWCHHHLVIYHFFHLYWTVLRQTLQWTQTNWTLKLEVFFFVHEKFECWEVVGKEELREYGSRSEFFLHEEKTNLNRNKEKATNAKQIVML